MFERNVPSCLQDVARYCVYKMLQNRGVEELLEGGILKRGEYILKGGFNLLGNYVPQFQDLVNILLEILHINWALRWMHTYILYEYNVTY